MRMKVGRRHVELCLLSDHMIGDVAKSQVTVKFGSPALVKPLSVIVSDKNFYKFVSHSDICLSVKSFSLFRNDSVF